MADAPSLIRAAMTAWPASLPKSIAAV